MERIKGSVKNAFRILGILFRMTPELLFLIVSITLLQAILPFVNIIISQLIIDQLIAHIEYQKVTVYAVLAISLTVIILLLIAVLSKKKTEVMAKFELEFLKKLSFHQMNFTLSEVESNAVKKLQRSIEQTKMRNGGLERVIESFESMIKNIFNFIIAILAFIQVQDLHDTNIKASFWNAQWFLFILFILTTTFVILTIILQMKQNAKISDLNQQANQANGGALLYMQMISDYYFGKDIRLYNLKNFLCHSFANLWKSSIGYRLTKKLGHERALVPCITAIFNGVLMLFIYVFIAMRAIAGEISAGAVIVYIGSTQIFISSIMASVIPIGELLGYGELFSPYLVLLDIPEEDLESNRNDIPKAPYTITFQDVSFKYPDSNEWVLENINFTIDHKQKVALVGTNGSGKSTAIKLLCRLYEPQKGKITLNGIDINEFSLIHYRQFISAVFQDFTLLSFEVGENIACSKEYSQEQVRTSLKSAGIFPENMLGRSLYKDYDHKGVEISGGEAQKIAIARAIYKNAPLFILDEPTAALDPRAEAEIFELFHKNIFGKMAIFISHRLSSCRFCDKIIVFNQGSIVQIGSHEQLVNKSGVYQELWEAQAQFYN